MKKRTRADKKRASENRIRYIFEGAPLIAKPKVEYASSGSFGDVVRSLLISVLMFGLLFLMWQWWR